jgi:hypothetical protein
MANVPEPATCQECGKPLPAQHGRGRQRRYCDATCRSAARRDRSATTTSTDAAHVNEDLTNLGRKSNLDSVNGEPPNDPKQQPDRRVQTSTERFVTDWSERQDSPLDAVTSARDLAVAVDEALRAAVLRARAAGHTWQTIGELLGTSRQAAFQRFGRPVEDPRTGEPMAQKLLPGATEHAVALLVDYFEDRFDRVRRDFDDTMLAQLDENKLAEGRRQVADIVGDYEGMGEPYVRPVGELTAVNIPLRFEAGEMNGQVAYRPDGKVAGLFIRLPGAS